MADPTRNSDRWASGDAAGSVARDPLTPISPFLGKSAFKDQVPIVSSLRGELINVPQVYSEEPRMNATAAWICPARNPVEAG